MAHTLKQQQHSFNLSLKLLTALSSSPSFLFSNKLLTATSLTQKKYSVYELSSRIKLANKGFQPKKPNTDVLMENWYSKNKIDISRMRQLSKQVNSKQVVVKQDEDVREAICTENWYVLDRNCLYSQTSPAVSQEILVYKSLLLNFESQSNSESSTSNKDQENSSGDCTYNLLKESVLGTNQSQQKYTTSSTKNVDQEIKVLLQTQVIEFELFKKNIRKIAMYGSSNNKSEYFEIIVLILQRYKSSKQAEQFESLSQELVDLLQIREINEEIFTYLYGSSDSLIQKLGKSLLRKLKPYSNEEYLRFAKLYHKYKIYDQFIQFVIERQTQSLSRMSQSYLDETISQKSLHQNQKSREATSNLLFEFFNQKNKEVVNFFSKLAQLKDLVKFRKSSQFSKKIKYFEQFLENYGVLDILNEFCEKQRNPKCWDLYVQYSQLMSKMYKMLFSKINVRQHRHKQVQIRNQLEYLQERYPILRQNELLNSFIGRPAE